MTIRLLALVLLLGAACANAAPPKETPVAPQDIDVDAMARAKDVDASAPAGDVHPAAETAEPESGKAPEDAAPTEHESDAVAPAEDTSAEATPASPLPASSADEVDVDAMARAKDVDASAPTGDEPAATETAEPESGKVPENAAPTEHESDAVAPAEDTSVEATPASPLPASSADEIDVDAMARAKDVDASAPTEDATPPQDNADDDAIPAQDGASPEPPAADDSSAASEPATAAAADKPKASTGPSDTEKRQAELCEKRAKSLLDAAQKGDYKTATRNFDATMRSALPTDQFRAAWESLAQFGALQTRGQSHLSMEAGVIAVSIPLIFEKANLYAQVACNHDNQVAGFYVKPLVIPTP